MLCKTMFTKLERRMRHHATQPPRTNSPVVAIASLNFPSKSTDSVRGREVLGSSRSLERRVLTPYRLGVFYSPLRFLSSVQPLPCVPPCPPAAGISMSPVADARFRKFAECCCCAPPEGSCVPVFSAGLRVYSSFSVDAANTSSITPGFPAPPG